MPIVAGIDEAGYGPSLGPLVVGATVWQIDPRRAGDDLWTTLRDCVCRAGERNDWRLVVDDSKAAFDRQRGISTLERTVLAFAQAGGLPCDELFTLLAALDPQAQRQRAFPWYQKRAQTLPLDGAHSSFAAVGQKLARVMDEHGAICRGLLAQIVTEDDYNERVRQTRNKAALLLEHVLRLISRIADRGDGQDVCIFVDRLGGRSEYGRLLRTAFPERHLHELAISDDSSRYRLADERGDWTIEFVVEADQRHLPVALASMLAKYVREALMLRFNAYWRELLPALAPTAGYYTDAQRFLVDIAPVLQRSGLAQAEFVRQR